jgi:hypothetical protein
VKIFGGRKYESGTRWCAWRWTDVSWEGILYLVRLHILKAPSWAVMLHWILGPDPHPDPHDHPVPFLSIVLRGGYTEWTPAGLVRKRVRWIGVNHVHRIVEVDPGTVTLAINGPARTDRPWCFHTPQGLVPWREYRAGKA